MHKLFKLLSFSLLMFAVALWIYAYSIVGKNSSPVPTLEKSHALDGRLSDSFYVSGDIYAFSQRAIKIDLFVLVLGAGLYVIALYGDRRKGLADTNSIKNK